MLKVEEWHVSGLEFSLKASGLPHVREWKDLELRPVTRRDSTAKSLATAPAGSGHDKWLNGVVVHLVIRADQAFWLEYETYNFAWDISSTSKMHQYPHMSEEEILAIAMGFELTRALVLNYRTIKTMHQQRRHHRLSGWKMLCMFFERLPYAENFLRPADTESEDLRLIMQMARSQGKTPEEVVGWLPRKT